MLFPILGHDVSAMNQVFLIAGHFRGRLWTHYSMAKMFLSNRECWMLHLGLNFTSGLDPEGIRVRNAQGLDAVDFFFPGA